MSTTRGFEILSPFPVQDRDWLGHCSAFLISLFLLTLLLLVPGCKGRPDQTGPTVRDSAGVTIVENASPQWADGEGWTLSQEPILDLGVMDGDLEYQFFEIAGAVRMPDGRLAVANSGSGEIRFYDANGRFLRASGGKESGPGEFEVLFFLRKTTGDSLIAYDWQNRRISVLTPQGDFTRSFEFTILTTAGGFPVVMEPFPDGDLLLATDMFATSGEAVSGAKRDSAIYYIISPEGETVETLGAYPGGESYETTDGENWVGGGLVFGKFGYAAVSGDGFFYGSSDRFEIECREKEGELIRILRLDQENLPVTQTDIDRYISDRMARARPERRPIYETMFEHMPFPDLMPAHGEFIADADRNLWVEEYRRPGNDQPRWKVFDPEGVYLGVVQTPPRFQIFELGSDYLLGRWRDDLDVEHVQLYQLLKG